MRITMGCDFLNYRECLRIEIQGIVINLYEGERCEESLPLYAANYPKHEEKYLINAIKELTRTQCDEIIIDDPLNK